MFYETISQDSSHCKDLSSFLVSEFVGNQSTRNVNSYKLYSFTYLLTT